MPKALITAGNVFDPTFDGVCYAVKKILQSVEAIHIFDTQESMAQSEKTQRVSRVRNILGPIDITTYLINDENLQTIIPNRLAQLIELYGVNELIVDLSNGQKITSNVLYAVSTISRISYIYVLELYVRVNKDTDIQQLSYPADWNYVQIQPLKEVLNITKSSYIELVYYRDRIEQIVIKLMEKNSDFASDVKDRLENSLVDYFTLSTLGENSPERLERCINGLGKICEGVAYTWYEYCKKHNMLTGNATNFQSRVSSIKSQWDKYRKEASVGDLDQTNDTIVVNYP